MEWRNGIFVNLFVKFPMVCIPLVCCFAPSGQTGQCLVRADAEDLQKTAHELSLIFLQEKSEIK